MNKELAYRIRTSVQHVVTLLVARDYLALERLTSGKRLKADHIRCGVEDYGRTIVMPPNAHFDSLDIVQVEGANPKEFSIRINLFTEEEGRSDLSVELTVFDEPSSDNLMKIQLDGILVF